MLCKSCVQHPCLSISGHPSHSALSCRPKSWGLFQRYHRGETLGSGEEAAERDGQPPGPWRLHEEVSPVCCAMATKSAPQSSVEGPHISPGAPAKSLGASGQVGSDIAPQTCHRVCCLRHWPTSHIWFTSGLNPSLERETYLPRDPSLGQPTGLGRPSCLSFSSLVASRLSVSKGFDTGSISLFGVIVPHLISRTYPCTFFCPLSLALTLAFSGAVHPHRYSGCPFCSFFDPHCALTPISSCSFLLLKEPILPYLTQSLVAPTESQGLGGFCTVGTPQLTLSRRQQRAKGFLCLQLWFLSFLGLGSMFG